MAPGQTYYGPIGMAESRFATAQRKREVSEILASNPELKAKKDADNILATREQIAKAEDMDRTQSTGTQIAQAQSEAIKQEVDRHTKSVERTVSTVSANARQILLSIEGIIKEECPDTADASLQVVKNLWQELEKLFEATKKAQDALPHFLERQGQNVSLIAGTTVREAYADMKQDMDKKDKRIELEHGITLKQEQAYKDLEANFKYNITELQERLSRLQLEHGSVRDKLDMALKQLGKAREAEQAAANDSEQLTKDKDGLNKAKDSLYAEVQELRGTIDNLEAKLKAAEDKAVQHYEKELRTITEQLRKEQQKATALGTHLKTVRQSVEATNKENEKMQSELKAQSEKYKNQSSMYGKMSTDLSEQTKKASALEGEIHTLQQQKIELTKERDRVTFLKDNLQKQHDALKSELDDLKRKSVAAAEEARQLSTTLKCIEDQKAELEAEHNDFRTKHNQVAAALKKAELENAALRSTVQNLKSKPSSTVNDADVEPLKAEIEELKERLKQAEANRADWESLGYRAMDQYREVQEKNQRLEGVDEQLAQAQAEIERLKAQPGGGSQESARHWRDKYNALLAQIQ